MGGRRYHSLVARQDGIAFNGAGDARILMSRPRALADNIVRFVGKAVSPRRCKLRTVTAAIAAVRSGIMEILTR